MTIKKIFLNRKILAAAIFITALVGGFIFFLRTGVSVEPVKDDPVLNQKSVSILDSSNSVHDQGGVTTALPSNVAPLPPSSPADIAARDATRISDLAQLQSDIQLYYKKCGYYPGVAQSGAKCGAYAVISTWADLKDALLGSKLGITNVPGDPLSGRAYFYGPGSDGKDYVLGAVLEDSSNPALAATQHKIINGVKCANSFYCVQP